jgi:hypothetical protein
LSAAAISILLAAAEDTNLLIDKWSKNAILFFPVGPVERQEKGKEE